MLMTKRKVDRKVTINANRGAYTLTHDQLIKSLFSKNNVAAIKSK